MRTSRRSDSGRAAVDAYAALHQDFGWAVPEWFNMAQVCSRRWAEDATHGARTAVIASSPGRSDRLHSYAELQAQANRLSNALVALGVGRGDRVAIVLPQRFETAVAYMAVLQMGAVGMPLSQLFGPEALAYRLHDSEAVVAICDASTLAAVEAVRAECPTLRALIAIDGADTGRSVLDWGSALAGAADRFDLVETRAEEAAVLIYTSGTTGNPKGALIPHRALIGNLSGFVCSQNWFGFDPFDAAAPSQAVFWSPADWAWTGGLMDALLPTLYFGRPIVGHNGRFSPELAFELLERHRVTHSFLFPTALKAMMKACPQPRQRYDICLQGLMSAGEAVGDAVFAWCEQQLGITVNEMFGQTEINYIVGNCSMRPPAAAPGRPNQGGAPSGGSDPRSGGAWGQTGGSAAGPSQGGPAPWGGSDPRSGGAWGQTDGSAAGPSQGGPAPLGGSDPRSGGAWGQTDGSAAGPSQGGPAPLGGSDPRSGGAWGQTGWPAKPGSMGKPYPGHRVAVIDEAGHECPVGVPGDVAVHRLDVHGRPDPIFFLGYWKNEAATRAKFTPDPAATEAQRAEFDEVLGVPLHSWCRTGDLAVRDADGYLWYQGRADDVFKAAGYRIGPSEIENCLVKHPAVANAAVVPKPDPERGAVVKAYVVLATGFAPGEPLVKELQAHVKGKLAPYEYPKEIEFVDALPMTTTGKVQRRVLRLQEEARYRAAVASG